MTDRGQIERILRVKENAQGAARAALIEATRAVDEAKSAYERAQSEIRRIGDEICRQGDHEAADLQTAASMLGRARNVALGARKTLAERDGERDARAHVLAEAAKEVRMLEVLLERAKDEARRASDRRDQGLADERALRRAGGMV